MNHKKKKRERLSTRAETAVFFLLQGSEPGAAVPCAAALLCNLRFKSGGFFLPLCVDRLRSRLRASNYSSWAAAMMPIALAMMMIWVNSRTNPYREGRLHPPLHIVPVLLFTVHLP